ncbi:hypothetical protein DT73_17255 [Mangrovibacter sp. MFB070]|uniref:carbon-nitrogen hydrolase family protein n=1 Tax=Mangrovibacter sp. MFB070 TaxID=1224318 RepID=UPI0004D561E5|nr:carbon-nitrogen hydrolase family protein [Mangrovibacter sp. MFB070]KEA51461.1 hypothetical protein DT73_17255 [Mangrovibacter sp. MFB070]
MRQWSVAAAQCCSPQSNLPETVAHHVRFIRHAGLNDVDVLMFPDNSLPLSEILNSGQESQTPWLASLQDAAARYGVITILSSGNEGGVAITPENGVQNLSCATLVCLAEDVFCQVEGTPVINTSGGKVALGINGQPGEEIWPRGAVDEGADIYLTASAVNELQWNWVSSALQRWALKYQLPILMANNTSATSPGKSACWDDRGQLLIRAEKEEVLVICRRNAEKWQGEILPLVN